MPRWLKVVLVVVAVLLIGAVAMLLMQDTSPGELVPMLTEGATVQLREEMRPARPAGPRVLVIALDGVGAEEFQAAIAAGRMPNLASVIGEGPGEDGVFASAYLPRDVLSILPSTTFAAWTSVYTGVPVAESGVAGNEWFDRETTEFVAPAPVSVSQHRDVLKVYTDSLLHGWIAVPTLFELADVRSYAALVAQYRGADLLIRPDLTTFGDLMTAFARGLADDDPDREKFGALDQDAIGATVRSIDDHGVPDLLALYVPGVDLYTHVAEPAIPQMHQYLADVVDPAIGEVLEAYRRAGALDETYIVFVSDHGHTPVVDDERNALGAGENGELHDVLEAAGFRVRPLELETSAEDFQAVLAYQGAFAYVHLADRSTCPSEGDVCDWTAPPRFQEDLVPALKAIRRAAEDGTAGHKLRGAIDLVFSREPRGVGPAAHFQLWDGAALIPIPEYLARDPRPDLLALDERLRGLGEGRYGHRAGDILVLARARIEDPREERFYFSAVYHSWHGSPNRPDSEILFGVAHPRQSGEELRQRVRAAVGEEPSQLSVTPLILSLLGREESGYAGP